MNHHFNRQARIEYLDAIAEYENAGRLIAQKFVAQVDETLDRIAQDPESYAFIAPEVRSLRVPDFPYSVIYMIQNLEFEVVAVAHASRRPGYWRSRVSPE